MRKVNKPLTEEQKANNKEKSRTRARVEHLFGFVENSIHPVKSNNVGAKQFNRVNGSIVRTIGIARAKAKIGMIYPVK